MVKRSKPAGPAKKLTKKSSRKPAKKRATKRRRVSSDTRLFEQIGGFGSANPQPLGRLASDTFREAGLPLPHGITLYPDSYGTTSVIPEVRMLELTDVSAEVLAKLTTASIAATVGYEPQSYQNGRYFVELAARYLAMLIEWAEGAAQAKKINVDAMQTLMTIIAIRRAREMYGQGDV